MDFALTEPGWFATAFAIPLGPAGAPDDEPGLFGILTAVLDELVSSGAIAPAARPGAEYVAWSAVHGIATLLSGSLRNLPPPRRTPRSSESSTPRPSDRDHPKPVNRAPALHGKSQPPLSER